MSTTVQIDDVRFRDALNRLASLGLQTGRVLKVEAKALLREIIKRTPPDDRAQGENAIKQDIFGGRKVNVGGGNLVKTIGIFFIIGENANAAQGKDGAAYFPRRGGGYAVEHNYWKPNATVQEMADVHNAARSRATGRVSIAGSMTKKVGRWRFVDRMTVKRSAANRYFRHIKQHVGKLKGGWAVAANALGINLPSWITRHANANQGFVLDDLGNGPSPSITIGNTSKGARSKTESAVKRALYNRAVKIKINVKRMLKHGSGASGDYGYGN